MNEHTGQFRRALFGGFRRQDVLEYIEELSQGYWKERDTETRKLHRQMEEERSEQEAAFSEKLAQRDSEIRELRRQMETERAEQKDLFADTLAERDSEIEELQEQLREGKVEWNRNLEALRRQAEKERAQQEADFAAQLAQRDEELEALRRQLEEARAERETSLESTRSQQDSALSELRRQLEAECAEKENALNEALTEQNDEIKRLCHQVETLTPQAESWLKIRDQIGEITMFAHVEARNTIQRANEEAERIKNESNRWVQQMQDRCNSLQEALHSAIAQAEGTLDGAKEYFRHAEDGMEGMQSALAHMIQPPAEEEALPEEALSEEMTASPEEFGEETPDAEGTESPAPEETGVPVQESPENAEDLVPELGGTWEDSDAEALYQYFSE